MNKKIIIIFAIFILIIILYIFKSNLFGCKNCVEKSKTFITEVKNIVQIAKKKNKTDGTIVYCKDSNNIDPLELQTRSYIFYYVEFDNDKIIKLAVSDTKNELFIRKEDIKGINVNDISEKDYSNNYDSSQIKCN